MQVLGSPGASWSAADPRLRWLPRLRCWFPSVLALWLRQQLGPCLSFEPVCIRGLGFRGFEFCLGTREGPPPPSLLKALGSGDHRQPHAPFWNPAGAAEQTPRWPVACFLGDLRASAPSALCCVAPGFRVPGFIFLDTGPPLGIWILLCG